MITKILKCSDHPAFTGPIQSFLCSVFNVGFNEQKFKCYMQEYYDILIDEKTIISLNNKSRSEVFQILEPYRKHYYEL